MSQIFIIYIVAIFKDNNNIKLYLQDIIQTYI